MRPEQTPRDEVIAAIRSAAAEDKRVAMDILIDFQDEVIHYDKSGHHGIGLWNIFRSKCGLKCSYGTFAAALQQFRKQFNLPPAGQRRTAKLKLSAVERNAGDAKLTALAPALGTAAAQEGKQQAAEPPRKARSVHANVGIPPVVGNALQQISVNKMFEAANAETSEK